MSAQEQSSLDFGADAEKLERRKVKGGLLITFEGGEGVGKSTQAERLQRKLQSFGIDVVLAYEPGSSELGNHVRSWIKRSSSTSPLAETLLFQAARAQLLFELVRPSLERDSVVILDRFTDSTLAYQGYGRGTSIETIKTLNEIATAGLTPDLTVLLDADPEFSLSRVTNEPDLFNGGGGRVDNESETRFEKAPKKFHNAVRKGYLELSKTDPRWCVVRADQAGHRVADAILKRVRRLLLEKGVPESAFKA